MWGFDLPYPDEARKLWAALGVLLVAGNAHSATGR